MTVVRYSVRCCDIVLAGSGRSHHICRHYLLLLLVMVLNLLWLLLQPLARGCCNHWLAAAAMQ